MIQAALTIAASGRIGGGGYLSRYQLNRFPSNGTLHTGVNYTQQQESQPTSIRSPCTQRSIPFVYRRNNKRTARALRIGLNFGCGSNP